MNKEVHPKKYTFYFKENNFTITFIIILLLFTITNTTIIYCLKIGMLYDSKDAYVYVYCAIQ